MKQTIRKVNLVLDGDENGWGLPYYDGYLEFPRQDESGISVLYQDHARSVRPHKHFYHELALVVRGNGVHSYQGEREVPLMPGDILMIDPHVEHSYVVLSPMIIINCQFFTRRLNLDFNRVKGDVGAACETLYEEPMILQRWDELRRETDLLWEENRRRTQDVGDGEKRRRGILSLSRGECAQVEQLLYQMIDEQDKPDRDSNGVKSLMLQMLLVNLKRIIRKQNAATSTDWVDTRQEKIQEVLTYVEEHIADNLTVGDLANRLYWSEGYFRRVFKEFTGFSPVQYINRKKILVSMDYIQKSNMNAQEAAARVGIYDPSYYSRLFKKHMGYSPRYISK